MFKPRKAQHGKSAIYLTKALIFQQRVEIRDLSLEGLLTVTLLFRFSSDSFVVEEFGPDLVAFVN